MLNTFKCDGHEDGGQTYRQKNRQKTTPIFQLAYAGDKKTKTNARLEPNFLAYPNIEHVLVECDLLVSRLCRWSFTFSLATQPTEESFLPSTSDVGWEDSSLGTGSRAATLTSVANTPPLLYTDNLWAAANLKEIHV